MKGRQLCADGNYSQTCEGEKAPDDEECNGMDDDCDGETDEEVEYLICFNGPEGKEGLGICESGRKKCVNGEYTEDCEGEVLRIEELCNGIDDDCDGEIDEDYPARLGDCFSGLGECIMKGTYICSEDLMKLDCTAIPLESEEERCADELDNDCDGETDEECEVEDDNIVGFDGGIVKGDGIEIVIPEGALIEEVEITVELVDNAPIEPIYYPVSPAYKLGPSGTKFKKSAIIIIRYNSSLISENRSANEMKIYRLPENAKNWESLESELIDIQNSTITSLTKELSYFQAGLSGLENIETENDAGCSCGLLNCLK